MINRRTALAGVASMFGASLFAPLARAAGAAPRGDIPIISEGPPSVQVFTPAQRAAVSALSDRVIPTTDTPGAIAAGVPDFIEKMLADWALPGDRVPIIAGLDALRLDDDSARAVGVRVGPVRLAALGLAAVLAGGAVAMAGPVVFLGLVAPHIARRLQGSGGMAGLAPTTCLTGAVVAVTADIAARLVVSPGEAPVGAVLALVGVPVLLALLWRRREAVL